jgi:hypothetical protein
MDGEREMGDAVLLVATQVPVARSTVVRRVSAVTAARQYAFSDAVSPVSAGFTATIAAARSHCTQAGKTPKMRSSGTRKPSGHNTRAS